ncbi:hypothetical protein I4F81_006509 [Pyropia yezoensis]|uniref:Uncharacterized protein n=1 Tax=Pyropia yezoensis TaxID=2788 RepID=A0ACC3C1D1_PYRYE|nr:hypothetical protein I4F81_006509 [Neopyropia yezoensis]
MPAPASSGPPALAAARAWWQGHWRLRGPSGSQPPSPPRRGASHRRCSRSHPPLDVFTRLRAPPPPRRPRCGLRLLLAGDAGAPAPTPAAPCRAGRSTAAGVANGLRRARATDGTVGTPQTLCQPSAPPSVWSSRSQRGGVGGATAATLSATPHSPGPLKASLTYSMVEVKDLSHLPVHSFSSPTPFFPARTRELREDASPHPRAQTPYSSRWCHLLIPLCGPSPLSCVPIEARLREVRRPPSCERMPISPGCPACSSPPPPFAAVPVRGSVSIPMRRRPSPPPLATRRWASTRRRRGRG